MIQMDLTHGAMTKTVMIGTDIIEMASIKKEFIRQLEKSVSCYEGNTKDIGE